MQEKNQIGDKQNSYQLYIIYPNTSEKTQNNLLAKKPIKTTLSSVMTYARYVRDIFNLYRHELQRIIAYPYTNNKKKKVLNDMRRNLWGFMFHITES